ncbi:MAG: hypothetical protein PHI86_01635 [Candidatus Omnitrophica bacterium]|nr:hypothetical protein [Candidatus Omnitrophota bacterium]HOX53851.1 hypothetical protein [Candidatus Omnitrophota bacterium]
MKKIILNRRFLIATLLCLGLLSASVDAFARDERGHDRGYSHGRSGGKREVVVVNHHRYYYDDGRFYRPGWFGFRISIGTPPVGIVISYLPARHKTLVIGNTTYYYCDNVYYKPVPQGYVVVPAPVVASNAQVIVQQPQGVIGETVVINVPNINGSYTPVVLTKSGNGYIGPQGEFYPGNPTVEQLRALYGKQG